MKRVSPFADLPARRCSGYALVTGLIFLSILTIISVTAMRSTSLEQRMSADYAFHTQAVESSEAGRAALTSILCYHIMAGGGWPAPYGSLANSDFQMVPVPTGLTPIEKDMFTDQTPGDLDAKFSVDINGDGTADLVSDLYVKSSDTVLAEGEAIEMAEGYEGRGEGTGADRAKGINRFFLIRSISRGGKGGATASTSIYYRYSGQSGCASVH